MEAITQALLKDYPDLELVAKLDTDSPSTGSGNLQILHSAPNALANLVKWHGVALTFAQASNGQSEHTIIHYTNRFMLLQRIPGGVLLVQHSNHIEPARMLREVQAQLQLQQYHRMDQVLIRLVNKAFLDERAAKLAAEEQLAEAEQATQNEKLFEALEAAQQAHTHLLPNLAPIREVVKHLAVYYKPKHQVGGDFYFFTPTVEGFVFALGDYTGHGIAGALGAVMCSSMLHQIVTAQPQLPPHKVLTRLHNGLRQTVMNSMHQSNIQAGTELLYGMYHAERRTLHYANVGMDAIHVHGEHTEPLIRLRDAIGSADLNTANITTHTLQLAEEDVLMLYTDGLKDQLGGPDRRRIGKLKLLQFIDLHRNGHFHEIESKLQGFLNGWMQGGEQTDDMTMIGMKF